jgi:hypothetical protein
MLSISEVREREARQEQDKRAVKSAVLNNSEVQNLQFVFMEMTFN